jgi:hypothetical protein
VKPITSPKTAATAIKIPIMAPAEGDSLYSAKESVSSAEKRKKGAEL